MTESKQQPIKVLLLEDSPSDQRLVLEQLKDNSCGAFEVEAVERLQEALKRLDQGGIQLILSDLNVPDGSGIEIVRQLTTKSPEVPVVVLTGSYKDEKVGLEAIQAGAQDYLFKGEDPNSMLRRVLAYALERHRAKNEMSQVKKSLERKVRELEVLNKVMMDREERILELKEKVKGLEKQLAGNGKVDLEKNI